MAAIIEVDGIESRYSSGVTRPIYSVIEDHQYFCERGGCEPFGSSGNDYYRCIFDPPMSEAELDEYVRRGCIVTIREALKDAIPGIPWRHIRDEAQ